MTIPEMLNAGHEAIMKSLEGISEEDAKYHPITTKWTLCDLMAHLAAHEHILDEVLSSQLLVAAPTLYIRELRHMGSKEFDHYHCDKAKAFPFSEILADLVSTNTHILVMLRQVTPEMFKEKGKLPWYGKEYSIEDYIKLGNYEHKLKHARQIDEYKKKLEKLKHKPSKKAG